MRASLFDCVNLVLGGLESAVLAWQAGGRRGGEKICAGSLTGLFSGYLRQGIWDRFAVREESEYDIRHDF